MHLMSRRNAIPSLTRAERLSLMSCVGVLQNPARLRELLYPSPYMVHRSPRVYFHIQCIQNHCCYSPLRQGQLPSHTLKRRLQTSPHSAQFEETQICNRKDNPPLWSTRCGFFLLFISNYKLFSYRSFTFSVSAGQIYFSRLHLFSCRSSAQ